MKTADLIPLILLELNDSNKYGLEIIKSIEAKSNNQIEIKQPMLYTILKKLEKSKFISSYWEDSEIGGKRHYYKITNNGRLQVSTLPSFDKLVAKALQSEITDEVIAPAEQPKVTPNTPSAPPVVSSEHIAEGLKKEHFSIMDAIYENQQPVESSSTPSVLPTNEIFADNNIDTATEMELNKANIQFLKEERVTEDEEFATNTEVSKFTKQPETAITKEYKKQLTLIYENSVQNLPEKPTVYAHNNYDNVKFVDYTNLKSSEEYKYAKWASKTWFAQSIVSAIYMLAMLILGVVVTNFTGGTPIFYGFVILASIYIVLFPASRAFKLEKVREEFKTIKYKINYKKQLIIRCLFVLAIAVICIAIGVIVNKSLVGVLFGKLSFANLYSPMLMSSTVLIDLIFAFWAMRKK